jgi:hypothetical protein
MCSLLGFDWLGLLRIIEITERCREHLESRLRSKWCVLAVCSWTTKTSALTPRIANCSCPSTHALARDLVEVILLGHLVWAAPKMF